jgi:hypothetical protein
LGQTLKGGQKSYLDFAPGLQLIFNSKIKLNVSHRYALHSSMTRMAATSWMIGGEWLFLNIYKK